MPYELLALPTSPQVPYELLALVFVPKRPQKEIEHSLFWDASPYFLKSSKLSQDFLEVVILIVFLLLFVGKPGMQKKQKTMQ